MKKIVKRNIFVFAVIMCSMTLCFVTASADEMQDSFLKDMADGLNARWAYDADEKTMSNSECMEYRTSLVSEEYERLSKYSDAEFESEKFNLMAHAYIEAIEMQMDAIKYYTELTDIYDMEWSAGYNLRASLIPDFVDHYGLDVPEEEVAPFRNDSSNLYEVETEADEEIENNSDDNSKSEIELYNNEGIIITVTGMDEPNLDYTRFKVKIENLNHHDIIVSTSDYQVVVNGNMIYSPLYAEVKSGKTSNTTMDFFQMDLDKAGIDKIRELSFSILISDAESYMPLYEGENRFLVVSDDYKVSERAVYTDKENIQKVQSLLNQAGYDCGSADGVPGKKTNSALLQFEKDHGLPETTDITPELIAVLEDAIN